VVAGCGLALGAALLAVACQPAQRESVVPPAPVQADFAQRIAQADAEPQNWLTTGRTYDESRYSPLDQISEATVGRLSLAWYHDLDTERGQEATPLVVDGIMYTTSAWSKVQAFDAATGRLLWQHDPEVARGQAARTCCDAVNRGAAYWNGKVYVGALDGRLIALDAKTGTPVWSVQTVDPALHYAVTGAPRIVKGRVIIGNGGAEFGVRGYVSAYDAETGKRVWRFYTVPGEPGKADGEVSDKPLAGLAQSGWSGQWWTEAGGRGGGTVWDSMAYDPELDLLYLGVGNASYWNKAYRSPGDGDNLFVASVLALRPETGEYVWHYQETPGDTWDYTSTQHMILANLTIDGRVRKVLMHAPKNGYFFVLDRATGKVITARPYIPLNWSDGLDPATGQPKVLPEARYDKTGKPWIGMPGPLGGHNWMPMSFHKGTGLVYFPAQENMSLYNTTDRFKPRPLGANTAIDLAAFALPDDARQRSAALATLKTYLLAWDPVAQKEVWRAARPSIQSGGVLSTAGNLVFQGDMDGQFRAHDARTGRELWSFDGQNAILAAPVTYAVNGRQYVTVASMSRSWPVLAAVPACSSARHPGGRPARATIAAGF